MKKSRFSEHQIIKILKEVEAGRSAKDVCREHGLIQAQIRTNKGSFTEGLQIPEALLCYFL